MILNTKSTTHEGGLDKLDFINTFCSVKDIVKKWKDSSQIGRKYLQKTYFMKYCYSKYRKNFET